MFGIFTLSPAKIKGATTRFVHLEKFSLFFFFFFILSFTTVIIFSILNHPRSLLVYSCLFGVGLPRKTFIQRYPSNFQKTTENIVA